MDSFLTKVDICKAYRHVPVHPSDYRATGLSWEFKLKEHLEFEFAYLYDTNYHLAHLRHPKFFIA